jgi:hypothetical protein
MDAHNHSRGKLAVIVEIAAITVAWVCGLFGFTAGLMTQTTAAALQGLALFYATFFYALARVYHFRRTDDDVVRVVRVERQPTDPFLWVDNLPKAASGKQA